MTIGAFLAAAMKQLGGIASARLDVLVLLGELLGQEKSWLLAHADHELSAEQLKVLDAQVKRRSDRVPLAYILGHKEFYGREFTVTPDVLIPRPDTEALIELAKKYAHEGKLLDVGTGSGAIAATLALELQNTSVEASDISPAALAVARRNAAKLHADVHFFASDLLTKAGGPYDVIVANLPYVASHWQRSAETHAEPGIALFADDDGLALIKKLIGQAPGKLKPHGYLLLEADPRQHEEIVRYAERFDLFETDGFAIALGLKV